jgi:hypothetical protein
MLYQKAVTVSNFIIMKYLFSIIVFLHGAIHLMGFVKGFKLAQIQSLSSEISVTSAIFWIIAFALFTMSAINFLLDKNLWLVFAIGAVVISSALIISTWSDAKFGMIPNVIILAVVMFSISSLNLNKMFTRETQTILSGTDVSASKIFTDMDAKKLPAPVYKWIQSTGMIGKPVIKSAYIKQKALMKMKPEQKNWIPAEAEQYTVMGVPAFIWTVDMNLMPLISIKGRDKFVNGKGEMLIKMNSLINLVNEKGQRMDEGTIQRYLGELVWYPSLALSPYISWENIDEFSAKATMNYNGTSGSGTFYFDKKGDFIKFIAFRFKGNEADAKRNPWVLTVDGYAVFEGIKVPSKMKATWETDEGNWTWLDLEITDIKYNINTIIN